MELSANNIILKLLGLLLLTVAVLKGYELLTEPVVNSDIWSNRNFLIFTVEFEFALGIWLLSGLFRKLAWFAGLVCFSLFCCVTLYKALAGYGSCGCFGKVHVNPWITLLVIDLPAVLLLVVFRPKDIDLRSINRPLELFKPLPNLHHFVSIFVIALTAIVISVPVLALNGPASVTSSYEVLDLTEWVGHSLPILDHIDIAEQLKTGSWLVVLYHHDCSECQKAMPKLEQMSRDLQGNEDFLKIALVEVPPYAMQRNSSLGQIDSPTSGKLDVSKEWFVATPATILIRDMHILKSWEKTIPSLEELFDGLVLETL